jgi:hypothetical protein
MYGGAGHESLEVGKFAFGNQRTGTLRPILLCQKSIQKPWNGLLILCHCLAGTQNDLKELPTLNSAHVTLKRMRILRSRR